MFNAFERMVAWRYLRARKAEGFVSVIAGFSFTGIMLGVATLIIVMSVMNGFRQELITRILGLNGHLNVYSNQGPLYDYLSLSDRIAQIDGVESVRPMVEGQALMSLRGAASGVLIRGLSREDFATKPILSDSIEVGELTDFADDQVAIGSALAERMRLRVGDEFKITGEKAKVTPFGSVAKSRIVKVGVIFDVGMYEYNNGFIFMPLERAQSFFRLPDAVNSLEVMASHTDKVDEVKQSVLISLNGQGKIYDWRDANSSFLNALQVERNVMFLILTLIILVAAFNIISSMIMLVKDKGKDIAILRTMGATQGMMTRIFVLTGASIGVAGTVVGAALGILFALNIESIRRFLEGLTGTELFADEIYFLSQLPAEVDFSEVITVIVMALVLSIGATLYPALRAARLDPVEALRYE